MGLNPKDGAITQSEKGKAKQTASSTLKNIKANAGEVIQVRIDNNTIIELPASLSEEERNERINSYKRRHKIR